MNGPDRAAAAVRASGLIEEGDRGVVLVSGGADSMTLLTGLAGEMPADRLFALHVNYGLREESDADEALVRARCGELGVDLAVGRAGRPGGNVQAWAREVRLTEAERIRRERDCDWIATGHTLTDQAETVLYRLVSSPGARALSAMPERSGRIIRPLLKLDRGTVRQIAETTGIPFNDDATNRSPAFARNRIRNLVMPELERINPAAEANIVRTRDELEEDEAYLVSVASGILGDHPGEALPAATLIRAHPAVRRRLIRLLAESSLGRPVAVGRELVAEAGRLAGDPEGGALDLGGGDRLVIESGSVRVIAGRDGDPVPPDAVAIGSGTTAFGKWTFLLETITAAEARDGFGQAWTAFLDLDGGAAITVRARRGGDRIDLLGSAGAKSLQDVFVDGRAPRSERDAWPVVLVGETIVWVPGLAVSGHHLVGGESDRVVRLRATPPSAP